jgi:hypothetical protein
MHLSSIEKVLVCIKLRIVLILYCFLIVAIGITIQTSYGLYFGHELNVTGPVQNLSLAPKQLSATEKGDVYVVWVDKNNIFFTPSHNAANKFTPKVHLSDSNKLSTSPQIAATEKGYVYVVWADIDNKTGDTDITFRSSNDGGKTFNPQKILKGGNSISFFPKIAATEKGDVYVAWVDIDNKTGDSNIEFIKSNDSGMSFNPEKVLRAGKTISFFPQITATEKGDVYLVWIEKNTNSGDSNIEFIKSNDSGMSFDDRKKITGGKPVSFSPQIAATEKGDVYVAWVDKNNKTGDTDITFRSSNDSGISFDDRKKLRRSESLLSMAPQIAATEKGGVYLVWTDRNRTSGTSDIVFRGSNDRGRDFERVVYLNKIEGKVSNASSPQIATTQNDSVYVVWVDNNIEFKEIFPKNSIFGAPISLSNKTIYSLSPEISGTKNGGIFVLWVDKNNVTDTSLNFKRISEDYFERNS